MPISNRIDVEDKLKEMVREAIPRIHPKVIVKFTSEWVGDDQEESFWVLSLNRGPARFVIQHFPKTSDADGVLSATRELLESQSKLTGLFRGFFEQDEDAFRSMILDPDEEGSESEPEHLPEDSPPPPEDDFGDDEFNLDNDFEDDPNEYDVLAALLDLLYRGEVEKAVAALENAIIHVADPSMILTDPRIKDHFEASVRPKRR